MEKHAEILAPAGGEAQLRAAVLCGADAVYLGLRGFNARAGAENFDENTLPQTVGWCHARGVRVYVTLNTLVTDREPAPVAPFPGCGSRSRGGWRAGAGSGPGQDHPAAVPHPAAARQHPNDHPQPGGRPPAGGNGLCPGGAGPGAFPRRRSPPSAPGQACGARSLCTGRCA